jgi:hypothetical protein
LLPSFTLSWAGEGRLRTQPAHPPDREFSFWSVIMGGGVPFPALVGIDLIFNLIILST